MHTLCSNVFNSSFVASFLLLPDMQPLDLENLFLFNQGTYNGLQAYKNSKTANVMFAYELARRLEGSKVTANAVCPGMYM